MNDEDAVFGIIRPGHVASVDRPARQRNPAPAGRSSPGWLSSGTCSGRSPTQARPDVDVLDGLTTAIIVDQQRMGSDPRSTVGTATDANANAMLRILFSRLGQSHIGPPSAYSFNTASVKGSGSITVAGGKAVEADFSRTGGMCPRCEGRGSLSDIDLTRLYDDSKSIIEGAFTIPGWKSDNWWTIRTYVESGYLDPHKPIAQFTTRKCRTSSTGRRPS